MDDGRNNTVDNAAAAEVYKKILVDYANQNRGRSGFNAVCPPEDQLRNAFTEALSQRIGRGSDGDEFDQAYDQVHAKNLAQFLGSQPRLAPGELTSVLERYKSVLRLDEQVARVCPEPRSSLLSIIPGYGPEASFRRAKSLAAMVATTKERPYLTDDETKALMEASLAQSARMPLYHVAGLGLTALICWRGRATYRFPFYKPKPAQQQILAAGRLAHAYRGLAYFTVYAVFGVPFVFTIGQSGFFATIAQDERLKELVRKPPPSSISPASSRQGRRENQERPSSLFEAGYNPPRAPIPKWGQSVDPEASRNSPESVQEPQQAAQSASQQRYRQSSYETPKSDSWDAPPIDEDDASPRAWSSQSQQGSSGTSGSAWDRVRQQSGYESSQAQGQQSQGGSQTPGSSWGSGAGISPEYRGPRESYSFSSADEGKAEAKSQAQREFDALLERERGGTDQGKSAWNRK